MNNPLIIFPQPFEIHPRKKFNQPPRPELFGPGRDFQKGRFEQRITNLDTAITNEAINLSLSIVGLEPERLLVFEIKGEIEDFYKAVEVTPGMEFLSETFIGLDAPDDSFIYKIKNKQTREFEIDSRTIPKRLFLTINNITALNELKKYWKNYQSNLQFDRGTAKFRNLFEQLSDIRDYSAKDRYIDTGILDYFKERLDLKESEIFFELELAFRDEDEYLNKVFYHIKNLVENSKGQIIESSYTIIKEIRYHALIAKVPIEIFYDLKEDTSVSLFICDQVLFIRPVCQSVFNPVLEDQESDIKSLSDQLDSLEVREEPVIALLDGFPLQNHSLLRKSLIIDDPDNSETNYPRLARKHGTAMASLIVYGDLSSSDIEIYKRKIYIRPILMSNFNPILGQYVEEIPNNKLFIDIIHSSVKRIMEDLATQNITHKIKIINLSIGDSSRPFITNNSSWARLIDWLAFKYNVLFIVSAGNYVENIDLDLDGIDFNTLPAIEREKLLLRSMIKTNFNRKIIAPAESLNALTVGSYNKDDFAGSYIINTSRVELLSNNNQVSPFSRIGYGYLRSIKPDILMPGGRQLYRNSPIKKNSFSIDRFGNPPGHKVAGPDSVDSNKGITFVRGTSNSAALATRYAARIYHVIENLSFETLTIPIEYYPVIIKALLVHGASNGNMDIFFNVIGENNKLKILPYIGHGFILDENKVIECTGQRVTLIGYGELKEEESQIYELPLPNEISSQRINKQLTITIAWFSPMNYSSNKYRKAALYIDNITGAHSEEKDISWEGGLYDFNASKRGTVQHLRYIGPGADAYIEDSALKIKVNCREDAYKLAETIKYGIAVTFELLDNTEIDIYNDIRQRIAQKVKIPQS